MVGQVERLDCRARSEFSITDLRHPSLAPTQFDLIFDYFSDDEP
jgi:hypothetical protein